MKYWFAGIAFSVTVIHQKYFFIVYSLQNTFLHGTVRQNFLTGLSFAVVPLTILICVFTPKFDVNLRLTANN